MDKMMKLGDRTFRLCEDVELAVKEKRTLYWINNNQMFELRCVSDNMGSDQNFLFLYNNGGICGEATLTYYRRKIHHQANYNLFFDVTPEKRYAIWAHLDQRFVIKFPFKTEKEAELYIILYLQDSWVKNSKKNKYIVVEFDNPEAE